MSARPSPLATASPEGNVGARHRRRCVDLVLRLDFDGAWHRPARSGRAQRRHARPSRPFTTRMGGGELSTFNFQREGVRNGTPGHRAHLVLGGWGTFDLRSSIFVLRSETGTGSGSGSEKAKGGGGSGIQNRGPGIRVDARAISPRRDRSSRPCPNPGPSGARSPCGSADPA